jgi:hypothetical protein
MNRRQFLHQALSAGAGSLGLLVLANCTKGPAELSCQDVSSLSEADRTMRTTLNYVDRSAEPGKACSGCAFYHKAPLPDRCGACTLVKGPINPAGYCTSYVPKPA